MTDEDKTPAKSMHFEEQTTPDGALDGNDGKEVPLVVYTNGQRNEIGTAKIKVTPGEETITAEISGVLPIFGENLASGLSIKVEETTNEQQPTPFHEEPLSAFQRYQNRGLTKNE